MCDAKGNPSCDATGIRLSLWAGFVSKGRARAGPHLPLLGPPVGGLQEGLQVRSDRGTIVLSLKDQPIEDEQEGLGEGRLPVLSLTPLCPSPGHLDDLQPPSEGRPLPAWWGSCRGGL